MSLTEQEFEALYQKYQQEILRLRHEGATINLKIGIFEATVLVANIQLALRHPENDSDSARLARMLTEQLIDGIREDVSPEVADILTLGFDPNIYYEEEEPYDPELDHQPPEPLPGPLYDPVTIGQFSQYEEEE